MDKLFGKARTIAGKVPYDAMTRYRVCRNRDGSTDALCVPFARFWTVSQSEIHAQAYTFGGWTTVVPLQLRGAGEVAPPLPDFSPLLNHVYCFVCQRGRGGGAFYSSVRLKRSFSQLGLLFCLRAHAQIGLEGLAWL